MHCLMLLILIISALPEQGFTPLLNGANLDGWVYGTLKGKTYKTGQGYQVKDGILFSTKEDGGFLYTEREYSDFILRFDFKLEQAANNGIALRAPLDGNGSWDGIEIQVLDDGGYPDIRPAQYHGSIYDIVPARRGFLKPVGEWNSEEIKAWGRQITVTLNGTVIVDADLGDIKDEAVLKKHPGLGRTTGHIGFLGHGARVEFRNVRLKEF
jgi:hypothetical protein